MRDSSSADRHLSIEDIGMGMGSDVIDGEIHIEYQINVLPLYKYDVS